MCTAGGRVRFAHIFCIESHPSHREPLRFPPKPKLRSTYQRVLPSAWTQKWYMYIASSRRGREQKMEVQVQQNSGHRGMLQDTNTHQKHPHCSMWKPRIPLHKKSRHRVRERPQHCDSHMLCSLLVAFSLLVKYIVHCLPMAEVLFMFRS